MNSDTKDNHKQKSSVSLASDSSSELHVLGHDGNSLGVDGAEVGVLEESDHVSLSGLLESKDSRGLESEVSLEVVGDLSHESLEWELSDEELGGLLVSSDVSESNGAGSESVGSLDSTGVGGSLSVGGLDGDGLSGGLGSGSLSSGMLRSCHFKVIVLISYYLELGPDYLNRARFIFSILVGSFFL